MNEQKIFKEMKIFDKSNYHNSKYLSRYGFIFLHIGLKKSEMDYIVSTIKN